MNYNALPGSDLSAETRCILPFQTQKYRWELLWFADPIIEINDRTLKNQIPSFKSNEQIIPPSFLMQNKAILCNRNEYYVLINKLLYIRV